MTKLISAAGFQLKGSGWYATDFKNSGTKSSVKKEEGGGDAKPADAKPAETSSGGGGCASGPCPACT